MKTKITIRSSQGFEVIPSDKMAGEAIILIDIEPLANAVVAAIAMLHDTMLSEMNIPEDAVRNITNGTYNVIHKESAMQLLRENISVKDVSANIR